MTQKSSLGSLRLCVPALRCLFPRVVMRSCWFVRKLSSGKVPFLASACSVVLSQLCQGSREWDLTGMLTLVGVAGRGPLRRALRTQLTSLANHTVWQHHSCRGWVTEGKIYGERNGSPAVIIQTLSTVSHSTKSPLIDNTPHQQRLGVHLLK